MSAVLLIGGSDSSGGAGLVRDVATVYELGGRALCAITAVTAQSDLALNGLYPLPPTLIEAQIASACAAHPPGAVKIGMLGTAPAVEAVAAALGEWAVHWIVLDPVLRASSGAALLDEAGLAALRTRLLPMVSLLTPNIVEAAALLRCDPADDEAAMLRQARALLTLGPRAVLLKGGHAQGAEAVDLLLRGDGEPQRLVAPRLSVSRRGTGCALGSAIATGLAQGLELTAACLRAKTYMTQLLQRSA